MSAVTDRLPLGTTTLERRRAIPAAPAFTRLRCPGLDGVRGVAILLVIVQHFVGPMTGGTATYLRGGFLGVDLFFVLSGFLITTSLLDERRRHGAVRLGAFYARRFLRLVPALVLFAACHAAYVAATGGNMEHERRVWPYLFGFVANWWMAAGNVAAWGLHSMWSLAVEEQFYLFWPATLLLLRRSRAVLAVALVSGIVLVAVNRIMLWDAVAPENFGSVYIRTDARADALLMGAALALVPAGAIPAWALRKLARWSAAFFVAAVVLTYPADGWLYLGGFTVVALGAAVMIHAVVTLDWGEAVFRRPFVMLAGRHSYALYLWNLAAIEGTFMRFDHFAPETRLMIAVGVMVGGTVVSHLLVEKWCLRWMRRLAA